jgi:hypothetical protein
MARRLVTLLGVGSLIASLLAITALAQSGPKATGGGQIIVGTTGGPGDTIAFTAQPDGSGATGQVQFVDREDGQIVEVFHGVVSCFESVTSNSARFAGNWTNQGVGTFEIFVEDNGEPNQGADMIFIDQASPPDCEDNEDDDEPVGLGRGNIQVHE